MKKKMGSAAGAAPLEKVGKRRLLKLAEFLDTLPPARFDMGSWAPDKGTLADCDTTACALGWATTIPGFRRAGLKMGDMVPEFDGLEELDAAEFFFGLRPSQASSIFIPREYEGFVADITPQMVARKIRALVSEAA